MKNKVLLLLPLILLLSFFSLFKSRFVKLDPLVFASVNFEDDIELLVVNQSRGIVSTVSIDGETLVDSYFDKGMWKLSSLWKLGVDNKLEGKLLVKSLQKNFFFPVYYWIEKGKSFDELNPVDKLHIILGKRKTNMHFFQRIRFCLTIPSQIEDHYSENDLNMVAYDLVGGEETKVANSKYSAKLLYLLSDEEIVKTNSDTLIVINKPYKNSYMWVNSIFSVHGFKAVSDKERKDDLSIKNGCLVLTNNDVVKNISEYVLNCEVRKKESKEDNSSELFLNDKFENSS